MHAGWLCFGDRCVPLDVFKKVNMVKSQQDDHLKANFGLGREDCQQMGFCAW